MILLQWLYFFNLAVVQQFSPWCCFWHCANKKLTFDDMATDWFIMLFAPFVTGWNNYYVIVIYGLSAKVWAILPPPPTSSFFSVRSLRKLLISYHSLKSSEKRELTWRSDKCHKPFFSLRRSFWREFQHHECVIWILRSSLKFCHAYTNLWLTTHFQNFSIINTWKDRNNHIMCWYICGTVGWGSEWVCADILPLMQAGTQNSQIPKKLGDFLKSK